MPLFGALERAELIVDQQTAAELPSNYWYDLLETWNSRTREEKYQFISDLTPAETYGFLRIMLGEPKHNLQLQNKYKLEIFTWALDFKPEALFIEDKNASRQPFPGWVDLATRFNLHEDGTRDEVLKAIRERFYPEEEQQYLWEEHYTEYLNLHQANVKARNA